MNIFDDLGKTLNDVAAATADMLGDFAETAKVKTSIVREKNTMEELFTELGKAAYEARKENLPEESDDPVDAICRKIAEKEKTIKDLEAEESELKAKEEAKKSEAAEETTDEAPKSETETTKENPEAPKAEDDKTEE